MFSVFFREELPHTRQQLHGVFAQFIYVEFRYEFRMGNLFVRSLAGVRRLALGECCFGVMYVGWCNVCNLYTFSVVEDSLTMVVCVCVSCFSRVYGVEICVVHGVVCVNKYVC